MLAGLLLTGLLALALRILLLLAGLLAAALLLAGLLTRVLVLLARILVCCFVIGKLPCWTSDGDNGRHGIGCCGTRFLAYRGTCRTMTTVTPRK